MIKHCPWFEQCVVLMVEASPTISNTWNNLSYEITGLFTKILDEIKIGEAGQWSAAERVGYIM